MRFVLASASPARLRTLQAAGVEPEVLVSGVDEDAIFAANPAELVQKLSLAKAEAIAAIQDGPALILGCDSLLELDGLPLGKPGTAEEATRRWRQMRGRTAHLHTGHTLIQLGGQTLTRLASTEVTFAEPTDAEIDAYVATGEPLQVAGAFTVDGLGGWFVESIVGDHHNVVGLSLPLLRRMLIELGLGIADLPSAN